MRIYTFNSKQFLIYIVSFLLLSIHSLAFAATNTKVTTTRPQSNISTPFIHGTTVKSLPLANKTQKSGSQKSIVSMTPNPCAVYFCNQLTVLGKNLQKDDKLYVQVPDPMTGNKKIIDYDLFEVINDQTAVVNFDGTNVDVDFSAEFIIFNPATKLASNYFSVSFLKYDVPPLEILTTDVTLNQNLVDPVGGNYIVSIAASGLTSTTELVGQGELEDGTVVPMNFPIEIVNDTQFNISIPVLFKNTVFTYHLLNKTYNKTSNEATITVEAKEANTGITSAKQTFDQNFEAEQADGFHLVVNGFGFKPGSQVILTSDKPFNFSTQVKSDKELHIVFSKITDATTITYYIKNVYTQSLPWSTSIAPFKPTPVIPSTSLIIDQNIEPVSGGMYQWIIPVTNCDNTCKIAGVSSDGKPFIFPSSFINSALVVFLPVVKVDKSGALYAINDKGKKSDNVNFQIVAPKPLPQLSAPAIFEQATAPDPNAMAVTGQNFENNGTFEGEMTLSGGTKLPFTVPAAVNSSTSATIPVINLSSDITATYHFINHYQTYAAYTTKSNDVTTIFKAVPPPPPPDKPVIFSVPSLFDLNFEIPQGGVYSFKIIGNYFKATDKIIGEAIFTNGSQIPFNLPIVYVNPNNLSVQFVNQNVPADMTVNYSICDGADCSNQVTTKFVAKTNGNNLKIGDVVATIETDTLTSDTGMLDANIPVPPGTFPKTDGSIPLMVKDIDGELVQTQVDGAAKFPDFADDGYSIVEIHARVHKDPAKTGGKTKYDVAWVENQLPVGNVSAPDAKTFLGNLPNVSQKVKDLLNKANAFEMTTSDINGCQYKANLVNGPVEVMKGNTNGDLVRTIRTYNILLPVSGQQVACLPHGPEIHAYFTVRQGSDVIETGLRVSNSAVNMNKTSSIDDPIGPIYFKDLNLKINDNADWGLKYDAQDPYSGDAVPGTSLYPIVKPLSDGTLHYFPQFLQFIRYLAIFPIGQEVEAQRILDLEGWGGPIDDGSKWSWWSIPSYGLQGNLLPNLNFKGQTSISNTLKQKYTDLYTVVKAGTNTTYWKCIETDSKGNCLNYGWVPDYPVPNVVGGPWQSHGVAYGGMTGGTDINSLEIETAYATSREGIRNYQLLMRMYESRQKMSLYNEDGTAFDVEQITDPTGCAGGKPLQKGQFDVLASLPAKYTDGDPYEFSDTKYKINDQTALVTASGKMPYYKTTIDDVDSIDNQHQIRANRAPQNLTWLRNDPMARDYLRMKAKNYRASYPMNQVSKWNGTCTVQSNSLLDTWNDALANPGAGAKDFGRDEGWGLALVDSYYMTANESERAKMRPWFNQFADLVDLAHIDCTGFLKAEHNPGKLIPDSYPDGDLLENKGTQIYEENIIRVGLQGLHHVFGSTDPERQAKMNNVIQSLYAPLLGAPSWIPGKGPWRIQATGNNITGEVYCHDTYEYPQPGSFVGDDCSNCDLGQVFALGYEHTLDPMYLDKAKETLKVPGGSDTALLNEVQKKASLGSSTYDTTYYYFLRKLQEMMGQYE